MSRFKELEARLEGYEKLAADHKQLQSDFYSLLAHLKLYMKYVPTNRVVTPVPEGLSYANSVSVPMQAPVGSVVPPVTGG